MPASPGSLLPCANGTRWFGTGHSDLPDARAAGHAAAEAAIASRSDAKLLVVFASSHFDLADLLAGIRERDDQTPLIGCSTAGEISAAGPGDAGVVVLAIGGDGLDVSTGVARSVSGRLRDAAAEAAACITEVSPRRHQVLLLLSDGLAGDQQEVVRGAYAVCGSAVPLVGGCAGDDLRMVQTEQLWNGEVLQDSIVVAALSSDAPIGIGVSHGWQRVGEPMLVTRSCDNHVYELDGEAALDVYLGRLNAPGDAYTDPDAFTRFALTHPLGISRRAREEVRFVAGADFEQRSLTCVAHVPQGGLTWIMDGDDESVLAATDAACRAAVAPLAGQPPVGLIAFDCIARRGVLGESAIDAEVERISSFAGGAPVAGFYTYGEIARTHGVNGFHNQTLVVLAIS